MQQPGDEQVGPTRQGTRVGVLGLGAMGRPIAHFLLRAGHPVVVLDLDEAVVAEAVSQGAERADTPAGLAAGSDVVLVLLPTDEDVRQACLGVEGLWSTARPGTTVLVCSSVRPGTCRELASTAPAGVAVLDAALTGGVRGAEAGEVNLLVGGDAAALDSVRAVLEPWTSGVHLLGGLGAGQVAKTANNLVHWAQIVAITEAFELARRYGLDPAALRQALTQGPTDSRTMREIEQMRLTWYVKDLENAFVMADEVGMALPGAHHSLEAMRGITVGGIARLLSGQDPQRTEEHVTVP